MAGCLLQSEKLGYFTSNLFCELFWINNLIELGPEGAWSAFIKLRTPA